MNVTRQITFHFAAVTDFNSCSSGKLRAYRRRNLAGYMVIENHTNKVQELITVTSSAFQKIEIHKTVQKDGMASMEGQNKLPIPAEGKVVLKPGGTHLMLINPTKRLTAGDSVSFVLKFASGSKSIISAPVKKAGLMNHDHHEEQDKDHNHDKPEHGHEQQPMH